MSAFKIKLILVGPPDSEKSELIQKSVKKRFAANYKLTVGVDILTKDVEFKPGVIATLSIWDLGYQQRFEFIRSTFYKGAAGALIVFNMNNKQSLTQSIRELEEIRSKVREKIPIFLIGNKIMSSEESKTVLDKDNIQILNKDDNCEIFESSTEESSNIDEIITQITQKILLI